jgi:hypothetical protein
VYAARIVEGDPGADGGPVVLPPLAEGIRPACESSTSKLRLRVLRSAIDVRNAFQKSTISASLLASIKQYLCSIANVTTTGHVTKYRYKPKGLQKRRAKTPHQKGFGPCRALLGNCEHSERCSPLLAMLLVGILRVTQTV